MLDPDSDTPFPPVKPPVPPEDDSQSVPVGDENDEDELGNGDEA